VVMNVVPFGVFVTVPVPGLETGLDGLIHISEISWEKVEEIAQLYSAGQKVQAKIIGFDQNTRRVDLSIKQLTEDPFDAVAKQYPLEKKVTAVIARADDNGVYLALEEGV